MAFTKTQIINRALVKLGSRPITNLDTDDTDESVTALNIYDISLEAILADIRWTFATKRALLATLDQSVAFDRQDESLVHVYQKPVDVVRIFETNDVGARFYEEQDTIVSDTEGLGIIYTFLNTDTATYPGYFVTAFADLLAADMAYPLLNSNSKAREMLSMYEDISLPKAESIDSQIGTARELNDNYWINSMTGGPNIREFS